MDEFRRREGLEALACLLGHQPNPPAADSAITAEVVDRATYAVDSLEDLELIYYFCRSLRMEVIGDPKSAFAVFHERSRGLRVYTMAKEFVKIEVSPCPNIKWRALEAALKTGATFHTGDGQPTCVSNGFTAHGADFADAAMRALLKETVNT